MPIKSICFIVGGYPTKDEPIYAFIRPTVAAIADQGIQCTVIAAQSVTAGMLKKRKMRKEQWIDETDKGEKIIVLQPKVFSFSNIKLFGTSLSALIREKNIKRCIKKYKIMPDVMYGHFWDNGIIAAEVTDGKVPVITVSGESKIRVQTMFSPPKVRKNLTFVKGVIAVSSKNLEESRALHLVRPEMEQTILPNAINEKEFYSIDQRIARGALGMSLDDIVAVFVGTFSERKGVLRVVEAAKGIPNLKLMLIGQGKQTPISDQIIFCGALPHEKIVTYLNAADFFVLPTRAEGCCNAVVEALSCGLPVISSNLSFNKDILNENNSIMINPDNIEELHDAMYRLCMDESMRKKLSLFALESVAELNIDVRAGKVVKFINQCIDSGK